jgi:hypothetical protein
MNLEEAAAVLAKAAGYDNRTVGDANVLAWHEALGDLDVGDALQAIAIHHRTSTDYLMPVHIRRLVADIRRERYEHELADEQRLVLEAYAANAGPLTDRSEEIRNFIAGVRTGLPPGDPKALNPRKEAWRRDHLAYVRQRDGEPNPRYRGIAPEGGWPMPETEVS